MRVLFSEEQKYRQPWMWLLIALLPLFMIILFSYGFYQQLVVGKPWGDKPMSDTALIIIGIFSIMLGLGVSILFFKTRMHIKVLSDKVILRYPPFIRKEIVFTKNEIESFYSRIYRPIKEYGGWGIKKNNKNNIAYNVYGNNGLQLELKSGKKVLIGTQRPAAFKSAMKKMMING